MSWALGISLVGLVAAAIVIYNRLIGLHKRADGAWADIDAQLRRRHDLIPALVESVKGYTRHERGTLSEVVARRQAAVATEGSEPGAAALAAAEGRLVTGLRNLFALAEDYPELRASERFGQLMEQLTDIEDHLQAARRYYNAVVRDLNTALARFPDLIVARAAGFRSRAFFEIEEAVARQSVPVRFDD